MKPATLISESSGRVFLRKLLSIFGKAPYVLVNAMTLSLGRIFFPKSLIFVRNSFAFDAIEPGYSDLDYTFVTDSDSGAKLFLYVFSTFKKIFPILGEVNLILKDQLESYLKGQNLFELRRDPNLIAHPFCKNLMDSREDIKFEAAVFVFRQWQSDYRKIHIHPEKRLKKWRYILLLLNESDLGLKLDVGGLKDKNLNFFIGKTLAFCLGIFEEAEQNPLIEEFRAILEITESDGIVENYQKFLKFSVWFNITQLPQTDLTLSLSKEELVLNESQALFLYYHVRWELYGSQSQKNQMASFNDHLNDLLKNLETIQFQPWSRLLLELNRLITMSKKPSE